MTSPPSMYPVQVCEPSLREPVESTKLTNRPARRIRPAAAADVATITRCVCDAYIHYIDRVGRQPAPMLADYAQKLHDSHVHVLDNAGRIRGVVVLTIQDGQLWLENMAVAPAAQRTGLGKALLLFAETEGRRLGFNAIYLCMHVSMTESQRLCETRGYHCFSRRSTDGFERLYYRKRLRA